MTHFTAKQPPQSNQRCRQLVMVLVVMFALLGCGQPHNANLVIDLEIANLPVGLTVTTLPVQRIEVSVSGPREVIDSLIKRQLRYRLDLSDAAPGVLRHEVDPAGLDLPKGVTITGTSPQALSLKIEAVMHKQVPIALKLTGSPAAGRRQIGSRIQPETVTLIGPRRLLSEMTTVAAKPIDIEGAAETIRRPVALDLDRLVKLADPETPIVAEIEIQPVVVRKTVAGIPVTVRGSAFAVEVTPRTVALVVQGPVRSVDQMPDDGRTAVYLDLKDLQPGVFVRRAVISLPDDTTLVSADPELFTVTIDNRPAPPAPDSGASPKP